MSSLKQLNKAELLKLVAKFEVNVDPTSTNSDIITALEIEGIDYKTYKKFVLENDEDEELDAKEMFDGKPVLIKMERQNGTFETHDLLFTREHPYQLVNEDTAQKIIDAHEGFRLASPTEAKTYYG